MPTKRKRKTDPATAPADPAAKTDPAAAPADPAAEDKSPEVKAAEAAGFTVIDPTNAPVDVKLALLHTFLRQVTSGFNEAQTLLVSWLGTQLAMRGLTPAEFSALLERIHKAAETELAANARWCPNCKMYHPEHDGEAGEGAAMPFVTPSKDDLN